MMQAKLRIVGGGERDQEIDLKLPATIGRGADNEITLGQPLISRRHCQLTESAGRILVRDLGSTNGTFIGSERVERERALKPGELLTIGTVTFRAIYGDMLGDSPGNVFIAGQVTNEDTESLADAGTVVDPKVAPDKPTTPPTIPVTAEDNADSRWA